MSESLPRLTEKELQEIVERHGKWTLGFEAIDVVDAYDADVPRLVEEIRRLQAENARLSDQIPVSKEMGEALIARLKEAADA